MVDCGLPINQIIQGDCLQVMPTLPDNSIDLICVDPPYYKVKAEWWDRQWESRGGFIRWIGQLCEQWQRILKPNGSLYCFASPKMAAHVEVEIGKRFNVLNHIVWDKSLEPTHALKYGEDRFRQYIQKSERIIFAEHYGADNAAKGEAGYDQKCDELRGFVFEPIRAYICGEFERAGRLNTEGKIQANVACGFSPSAGGMASRHYFSQSQWQLPTEQHYLALQAMLGEGYLTRPYDDLRQQYDDLKREFEQLRRPFNLTPEVPYTDTWTFPTVSHYKGKHPCEKPLAMLEHIIRTSTRQDAVVLDCFAGSGSTLDAAKRLGRRYIGVEFEERWVNHANARLKGDMFE